MKIILSRKGFDSANGGIVSPIFENGTMLTFPIPSNDKDTYNDLQYQGVSYSSLLSDLKYKGGIHCHIDPDLDQDRRVNKIQEWVPAFGQTSASSAYLKNIGVQKGDIFLFFGNFHCVEKDGERYHYLKRTGDFYKDNDLQVIWGYLQVGELSDINTLPALRSIVSNERVCQASELKSLLEALSWKHIVSSSSYVNLPFPISSIYGFIYYSSGDLQILSNDTPNSGVGTFDTDTGTYTGGTGLYNIINNIIGVPIHEPRQYLDTTWANWGIISGFHGRNNTTIQDVSDDVILHTEPIKDQNGNILIPANCSISDFFDL